MTTRKRPVCFWNFQTSQEGNVQSVYPLLLRADGGRQAEYRDPKISISYVEPSLRPIWQTPRSRVFPLPLKSVHRLPLSIKYTEHKKTEYIPNWAGCTLSSLPVRCSAVMRPIAPSVLRFPEYGPDSVLLPESMAPSVFPAFGRKALPNPST
jgi:hypothetical protein